MATIATETSSHTSMNDSSNRQDLNSASYTLLVIVSEDGMIVPYTYIISLEVSDLTGPIQMKSYLNKDRDTGTGTVAARNSTNIVPEPPFEASGSKCLEQAI